MLLSAQPFVFPRHITTTRLSRMKSDCILLGEVTPQASESVSRSFSNVNKEASQGDRYNLVLMMRM
jgi:hypothetical protein